MDQPQAQAALRTRLPPSALREPRRSAGPVVRPLRPLSSSPGFPLRDPPLGLKRPLASGLQEAEVAEEAPGEADSNFGVCSDSPLLELVRSLLPKATHSQVLDCDREPLALPLARAADLHLAYLPQVHA